jgi:hypothetical protein
MLLLNLDEERQAVLDLDGQVGTVSRSGHLVLHRHHFFAEVEVGAPYLWPGAILSSGEFDRQHGAVRLAKVGLARPDGEADNAAEVEGLHQANELPDALRLICE